MSNKFIRINNNFFNDEHFNTFCQIGTEGFLLYSYMLYEQGNNTSANITIKSIQTFLNRDYDKRPIVEYDNKKTCKIGLLKDKRTIQYYINKLVETKSITLHNKNDVNNNINLNSALLVSVNKLDFDNGFTLMPNDIFLNYIHKIGHIGWSILCLLSKLHNAEYGNKEDGGFANPTEEYISRITKSGLTSVKAYLRLLEQNKLIKIKSQPPIIIGLNKHGEEVYEYTPNHYIVRWKITGDKNYFEVNKKE